MKLSLISFLFALGTLATQTAWSQESATAIALKAKIYPQGLYPGHSSQTASEGDDRSVDANGAYDVLTSLTNVTGLRTDASQGGGSDGSYQFSNLRIASTQTTYDDYLIGYFSFDLASQKLAPTRFERAPSVGIYEPTKGFLIKDSTSAVNFYTNAATPSQFAQGNAYTFQSSTDYYTNLTVGQRLCVVLSNLPSNQLCRLIISMQDGGTYLDERATVPSGTSYILSNCSILVSGKYRFRVEPISPASSFGFGVQFYNENGGTTTTVTSGNTLSASLGGSAGGFGSPYKKFKVRINSGQTVSLPGDSDTSQTLINDRGVIVGGGSNVGFNVPVTATGDYYIVIEPRDSVNSASESYSGVLTITTSLSFSDWAWSYHLAFGHDGPSDDADGDGMKNLLEYALGMNPTRPDASSAPQIALSATQLKLIYNRPDYVQNVTVQPGFSTDLKTWSNVTGAAVSASDGVTQMQAVFPRSGKHAFGQLRVTDGSVN